MDIVSPVRLNGRSYSPAIGLLKSEISYISVYFSAEMGVSWKEWETAPPAIQDSETLELILSVYDRAFGGFWVWIGKGR